MSFHVLQAVLTVSRITPTLQIQQRFAAFCTRGYPSASKSSRSGAFSSTFTYKRSVSCVKHFLLALRPAKRWLACQQVIIYRASFTGTLSNPSRSTSAEAASAVNPGLGRRCYCSFLVAARSWETPLPDGMATKLSLNI